MDECTCGNERYGFDCVCDHLKKYPGDIEFICPNCGIYSSEKQKCDECKPLNIFHYFG